MWFVGFLRYFLELLALTLGTVVVCGFAVRLCSYLFSRLMGRGSDAIFDVTSIIGTPVHELGHALMCPIFAHRITAMKLWSPRGEDGVYGYVEHSYNGRNLWARLGNLFIGLGPIFSGLGVIVLTLWLCFPTQWGDYLVATGNLAAKTTTASQIWHDLFSLLISIPSAFAENWWRALIGLCIILPVSLHVSLSWADVKGSLSAFPLYLVLLLLFALPTSLLGWSRTIVSALELFNLRLLSLFCLVVAFAAVWVLFALLVWLVRRILRAIF